MENLPSLSVWVLIVLPFKATVTPGSPAPLELTVPVTGCWAKRLIENEWRKITRAMARQTIHTARGIPFKKDCSCFIMEAVEFKKFELNATFRYNFKLRVSRTRGVKSQNMGGKLTK